MKRLLVLVIGFCAACDDSDNVGSQCQDTQIQCMSDEHCANAPGSTCSSNGVCTLCGSDSSEMPDAATNPPDPPACTNPPNPVQCGAGTGCSDYPGTSCVQGLCVCPDAPACTNPPNPLQCSAGTTDCSNYPGTSCVQGLCVCP